MLRIKARWFMLAAALILAPVVVSTQTSGVTTITCEGAASTIVAGINDAGRAVGFYSDDTGPHGFITDGRHGCETLPGLPDGYMPIKLNDSEHVIGIYTDTDDRLHGFLYRDGRMTDLWYPGQTTCETFPIGINNRGQVVGSYDVSTAGGGCGRDHAFMWQDGTYVELPGAEWMNDSVSATSISARGDVLGSWNEQPANHGYLWRRDAPDPVSFGFPIAGNPSGVAMTTTPISLNARGDAVGFFYAQVDPDDPAMDGVLFGPCRGFFRDRDGAMTELAVPGATYTCALGLNAAGEVSGIYTMSPIGTPFQVVEWRGFIAKKEALVVQP